jgi:hypothetical protein
MTEAGFSKHHELKNNGVEKIGLEILKERKERERNRRAGEHDGNEGKTWYEELRPPPLGETNEQNAPVSGTSLVFSSSLALLDATFPRRFRRREVPVRDGWGRGVGRFIGREKGKGGRGER